MPSSDERPEQNQIPRTFADMGLATPVAQALADMGFSAPTDVQSHVFGPVMAGRDLIVQARTGSGKTAAFGIPFAQGLVSIESMEVQALVLCPTRELALQVSAELARICGQRELATTAIYGGAPMGRQIEALRAGAQIVSGTPGRVLDHLRRGTLKLGNLKVLVLDECDEMLSRGFQEEIEAILSRLPAARQTLLFSATVPEEIERIAKRYMRQPESITLSADFVGVYEIDHAYYLVSGRSRPADLVRVLRAERPESAIIFCNTRDDVTLVARYLKQQGYSAEPISSDFGQSDRERVMGLMRGHQIQFLVATEIAARGIDITELSHVINYTFPESAEMYVHRTGRTGRAGRTGAAISLVSPAELGNLFFMKMVFKISLEERDLPTEAERRTRRESERLQRLLGSCDGEPGDEWRSLARRVGQSSQGERLLASLLRDRLEKSEAAAASTEAGSRAATPRAATPWVADGRAGAAMAMTEDAPATGGAPAASPAPTGTASNRGWGAAAGASQGRGESGVRRERSERPGSEPGLVRLYLNLGSRDGLSVDDVLSLLAKHGPPGVAGREHVDLRPTHTYLDVPAEAVDQIIGGLRDVRLGRRRIVCERTRR